jgi:multidrug efflux system outer membrane protein
MRRIRTGAPLAAALLALGACAVGPSTRAEPAPPPVPTRATGAVPDTARALLDSLDRARTAERTGAPAPAADAAGARPRGDSARRADSLARPLWVPARLAVDTARDLAWLDVLRDPQLVRLVEEAVVGNRDLRAAQARVQEYRAQLAVARSGLFPQIGVGTTVSRNQVAFGPQVVGFEAVRVVGDLGWELDFWGRVRRQGEAAGFDLRAREEDVRATVLSLVSDVATAYLQLRELDEDVAIADRTLASRRATLDLARRRFQQGLTSQLDVSQFEAQLAEPAARVADFARQRALVESRLSALLGSAPRAIERGLPLATAVQAVTVPDSIPGALVARRPDVLGAQRDLQSSVARIGVAVGNRLPAVSLGGQYGTQRPDFSRLFAQQGEVYALQAGVSVPLFTGGRLRGEERAARARADQARARYEQIVIQALRESSDALAGVRLGRDQLVAQATQVQALERAFGIAEQRYRSGISSYLEVLDAQRQLFGAQLTLVQVQRQYLVSTVDLYRALGGGWEEGG